MVWLAIAVSICLIPRQITTGIILPYFVGCRRQFLRWYTVCYQRYGLNFPFNLGHIANEVVLKILRGTSCALNKTDVRVSILRKGLRFYTRQVTSGIVFVFVTI